MKYVFDRLDEEVLRKLYTEFKIRDKEIAEIIGVTSDAVLWRRKKYRISNLSKGEKRINVEIVYNGERKDKKKGLTDGLLEELYSKGLSDVEIGSLFNMTGEGVAYRRKRLKIRTITAIDRRREANIAMGQKDLLDLTMEELSQELKLCRGIKGVAKKYRSTFETVKNIFEREGVNRDDVLRKSKKFTILQKKLIIGGLLGDGGVYPRSENLCYYKESHCVEQFKYLKWKFDILKDLIEGDIKFSEKVMESGTKVQSVNFNTLSYVEFKEFRDLFYEFYEGKWIKIIPESVLYSMDFFTFCIWYCDDGYLNHGIPTIVTGSPIKYVEKAVEILNNKFILDAESTYNGTYSCVQFNNIDNFVDVVRDYLPPYFSYKIPKSHRFKIKGLGKDIIKLRHLLDQYTPQEWRKLLSFEEKQKWVDNIALYYQFIGFPYFRYRKRDQLIKEVKQLKSINLKPEITDGVFYRVSSVGSELASSYFPNMWASKMVGSGDVLNKYEDSNIFKKVIENVLKHRKILSDSSIRNELRQFSSVRNFKPVIAKTIYDIYCPVGGTVFDYSAGWGGRLLGAYGSKKVKKYIGIEPNRQTFLRLRRFDRRLRNYFFDTEIELYNECSEDGGICSDSSVDLCFSSPPYFNLERYSDEETQSINRYPEYNQWLENFLKKTIKNCFNMLKGGGYFAINISNTPKYELQRDVYEFCVGIFKYVKTYLMVMPTYFGREKYEPIFFFKKDVNINNSIYDTVLEKMEEKYESYKNRPSYDIKRCKDILRSHKKLSDEDRRIAIISIKQIFKDVKKINREYIKNLGLKKFPFPVWVIERDFGSWNKFIMEAGLIPEREIHSPYEHVECYFKKCLERKRILSFYDYEKQTGKPASRLKRLFNAGKRYHHLKEELFEVALKPDLWDGFLKKFD